ncbi:linear gramicidin synthase subunit D [Octopus sinensis]|uniref:Fatty acid synthase n=1 Tax=Octopus sinensis TaxID=2607531 RepID=A0A6P7T1X3_9MOLL|nr:linear gramicidin synthase subunit D [Octopus sinensis]XP_036364265.1 linear gramicidin synthase subunit D [Octopus sinensis]XP_036364266.1 linear gramicidin synthase subunit D [Octopus sinensis]
MASQSEQRLLHELFREQAKRTPYNIAVHGIKGETITFQELDQCTDVLANILQSKGVVPNSSVAIYLEKSLEFTVSYLAILKAGGAYLPLDISYPEHLIKSIIEEAEPKCALSTQQLRSRLPENADVVIVDINELLQLKDSKPLKPVSMDWSNLAYVAYSSGTTGKPKGIKCPHRGAVLSYKWRHKEFPYKPDDKEACNVFFIWEMLRPLLKGIPMYIIPDNVIYDPIQLCKFLKNNQITRMLFTPSLLEVTLNTINLKHLQDCFSSMRIIIFCGEVVTTPFFKRCIASLPHIQFVNLYSISECHDVACVDLTQCYTHDKDAFESRKFSPVGKHLPNVDIVIMNENLEHQPVGVSGEIYIGGPSLACGYLKMPKLNAERFIKTKLSPNNQPTQLYRTGDWGYMLSNGDLEICGRCDSMVKIRGYSVEVQAVEASLMSLSSVNNCVVLVKGNEGEDKFLIAYVVTNGEVTRKDVRNQLKKKLPFYMIPSYILFLESIPVVPATGKLDKKALPEYNSQLLDTIDLSGVPITDTEKKLAKIWMTVLQLSTIDIEESFFDLGGHSLLAATLLNDLKEEFKVELNVKDLFLFPTVKQQAQLIEGRLNLSPSLDGDEQMYIQPNLLEEVERHDPGFVNIDMSLRAFWRSFHVGNRWHKGRIFVTGATGFLGAFLIQELLLNTKTFIYCLVREQPNMDSKKRLMDSLKKFGILPKEATKATEKQKNVANLIKSRVATVKGDVAIANLGMNMDDYLHMCTEIDFIIHAAALVNLAYPYNALETPNVQGTHNIILFAFTGKVKPLHYISTDAVFPHGLQKCSEDSDITIYHEQLTEGYSQSKWVAEQLVQKAKKRGLPVVIYRLGNLAGDRDNVCWNPQDFTLLMLQSATKFHIAPDIDWRMEMTPVDFTANIIVRITQNLSLAVGKVLHIINTRPVKSSWVFEWMNSHGYSVRTIPFEDWRDRMKLESTLSNENKKLWGLVENYAINAQFFSTLSTFRNCNLLEILEKLGLTYPDIDSALLKLYFDKLCRQGVFQRLSRMSAVNTNIHGKVVIVTGASSGIGCAIAEAFVKAGANVAMAARREDKLQELCKKFSEDAQGHVIAVKTDVTNKQQVKELVQHTECSLGPVDILVNCAGVMYYTLMRNLKEEEWERMIDINCKGVTNCIGAVLDGMIKKKSGHIVNISSDAGRRGFAGLAVYSGSKFFVEGLSQALRQEVASLGIRVTCLQPGDVKTELLNHTTDQEAKNLYDGSSNTKILEPDDVAQACIYATSQPAYVAVNEILIEPREAPI